MHRNVVMTPCRWETHHILEFCLYHREIGFDHVYIYCNDDDPDPLYQALLPLIEGSEPFVTFVIFGLEGQQRQMVAHWFRTFGDQTERVAFLDADEFLFLPRTNHLDDLLGGELAQADAIYLNWSCFGPSGHAERPEGSVLLNYRLRERFLHPFTKTIIRSAIVDRNWLRTDPGDVLWHGNGGYLRQFNCRNVLGRDMRSYYADFPAGAEAYVRDPRTDAAMRSIAVINHYSMKSAADGRRRAQRSLAGEFGGQAIWGRLDEEDRLAGMLSSMDEVRDDRLADFWRMCLRRRSRLTVCSRPASANLALGKPAMQSSVSEWSLASVSWQDAANAVNGRITGRHQFHTAHDPHAWWKVDLEQACRIEQIRLFNRLDPGRERLARVLIEISLDGAEWQDLVRSDVPGGFGGADGNPFVWEGQKQARHVRVSVENNFLHLDQVEVYGVPAGAG